MDNEKGFTILELIIAMSLSLFLIGGLLSVHGPATRTFRLVSDLAQLQENARFALSALSYDVRLANYYGRQANADRITPINDSTDSYVATSSPSQCASGEANEKEWVQLLSQPIFGYDHTDASPSYLTCISDIISGSDLLVLRMGDTQTTEFVDLQDGVDYLYTNFSKGHIFRQGVDAHPPTPELVGAVYNEFKVLVYYIANNPSGTPALFRFDSISKSSKEVVEGIEQIQLSFGATPTASDRFVEAYYPADEVPDWSLVTTVKIDLMARSSDGNGSFRMDATCKGNTRTYTLGNNGGFTPSDSLPECYRRRVFTSIVQIR